MFDRNQFSAMLAGAAGGAIAIASMELFSASTAFPLVAIPFATSIVTVLGSPKAEPAQPRALIGGHLISTLVGPAHRQAVRTSAVGRGAGGWPGYGRDAPDPHVSSASRDRSVGGGRQQHVMELPGCAGRHRRAATRTVCLRLA